MVRERITRLKPDVALATAAQADAVGGIDDLAELAVISDRDDPGHADPMGVADAFAGGFLSAFAAGAGADDSVSLGREMAARCGALPGPLP